MKNLRNIIYGLLLHFTGAAQMVNAGFESTSPGSYTAANSVTGWTLSSQTNTGSCPSSTNWTAGSSEFSVVSTPIIGHPDIGNLMNSPLGGTNVAVLNSTLSNSSVTKLSQTFSVNSANSLLQFAFAGAWQGNGHQCCDQPGFTIQMKDAQGIVLSCLTYSMIPSGSSCQAGVTGYSVTNGTAWCNWQVKYIDLTPFIGTALNIEIICSDCTASDHYGTLLADVNLGNHAQLLGFFQFPTCTLYYAPDPVNLCQNSSQAQIIGPLGYAAYQWIAPGNVPVPGPQGTMSTLYTTSITPGSVYTVNLVSANGCSFVATYSIGYTVVNIVAIANQPSCQWAATGSATVLGTGSSTGYNYTWVNSNNAVVGTTSVAANLSPGNYTVTISSTGNTGCGTSTKTLNIGNSPTYTISYNKPFCGTEAYLSAFSGTNYQWYNNLSPITASLGGTASSYTLSNPVNGGIVRVAFINNYGCRDSIIYTLVSTTPGSVSIVNNKLICPGGTNGSAVVTMTPATGSPPGSNSYSVFSTGTLSPVYSASLSSTAVNTFTFNSLTAGASYSVIAFDGACKYSTSFSVTGFVFDYTVNPSNSPTICSGNAIAAGINFTSTPTQTQYSFAWSPSTFLTGTNAVSAIILPTVSVGSATQITYTVVVTPSVANCPKSKTFTITVANPSTPTITPVPAFCKNSPIYTLSANPAGGTFTNNVAISPGGLFTPSLAALGVNNFTYANSVGTCVAKSSASFIVNAIPVLIIQGNTSFCEGLSTTLLASGANTYLWDGFTSGPLYQVTPSSTTTYSLVGTNAITNCSNNKTITVSVYPNPTVTISGDTILCLGESITLTGNGADDYYWSTGSQSTTLNLSPTSSASYTLIGTNTAGLCTDSKIIHVQVSVCTGFNELNGNKSFRIYPNPTNGQLFIETENEVVIMLYDGLGRIVLKETLLKGVHSLDLSSFNGGVYQLKTTNQNGSDTKRIIKLEN